MFIYIFYFSSLDPSSVEPSKGNKDITTSSFNVQDIVTTDSIPVVRNETEKNTEK